MTLTPTPPSVVLMVGSGCSSLFFDNPIFNSILRHPPSPRSPSPPEEHQPYRHHHEDGHDGVHPVDHPPRLRHDVGLGIYREVAQRRQRHEDDGSREEVVRPRHVPSGQRDIRDRTVLPDERPQPVVERLLCVGGHAAERSYLRVVSLMYVEVLRECVFQRDVARPLEHAYLGLNILGKLYLCLLYCDFAITSRTFFFKSSSSIPAFGAISSKTVLGQMNSEWSLAILSKPSLAIFAISSSVVAHD